MKRGPDLDIEALFTDLGNDPLSFATNNGGDSNDIERDVDGHGDTDDAYDDDDYALDDEYIER